MRGLPEGYEVFYLSHYGRHGSRWLPHDSRYEWVNSHFADERRLTPFGRKVKKRLLRVWRNARGHGGQLTALGARQHRGIARRMAMRFPQVFADSDAVVSARSSTVPRCRASMLAFTDELLKLRPQLAVTPETDEAFMDYLNHETAELKTLVGRTQRAPAVDVSRFMGVLFADPACVDEPERLLTELHTIASDMQDVQLRLSLWDLFTHEEMMAVHDANNERMTLCHGDTPENEGIAARSSLPLWENIVAEAEQMTAAGGHGASLRFGHDTSLLRLLTLMGLELPGPGMEQTVPMAANLQMVFLRRMGSRATDDLLVGFLLNEAPCRHKALTQACAAETLPLYRWKALTQWVEQRRHSLEHLRQLSALNTMVGTAPATTRSAGLFGKGSEEHGQTLPAVLVPNGQTFWTPQTRDGETKCVAPYYYTDSLLQGLRASHWLVGGCTQDYGSFTVAALGGRLRTQPEERATRFSHNDETSHPYCYRVTLPDEHLLVELTAVSHTAVMRVTSLQDGPVHIVLNHNSDEGQGTTAIDTALRRVQMSNPVHRIYQGWGEGAGFSGHMVVTYDDEAVACHEFDRGIALTFNGHRGRPLVLTLATSFVSIEGALANMQSERGSFEQLEQRCQQLWVERLHTIDVDDADTALVNQFYGALYRASFLPREMSDVDGRYIRFASQGEVARKQQKHYGDFSMWDTYRALHPLLCLIAPEESGQMMQSLVDMGTEGGWLPIFPCWNSYTAAMIGDHCAAALADAWVKGICNFDGEQALRLMVRNAMQWPASAAEYADGMGRRALPSYMRYGYIPLEDSVPEAFHQQEQTSRTLEYAYDDYCVAQMAAALGHDDISRELTARSGNWRNVINPATGYADGRHADGRWENNTDLVNRKPYITEGATCHYTWYVPHDVEGLMFLMGGREAFAQKLDSMFTERRYWHGNEPCHQVAWLFTLAGHPEQTRRWVRHIINTEYDDTPGGLSGNDDAGQMSAWFVFACMGFYPVCPGTPQYVTGTPVFSRVTINSPGHCPYVITADRPLPPVISHQDLTGGN